MSASAGLERRTPTRESTLPLRLVPATEPRPAAGVEVPDLFRLCDLVAESIGAPVTIEDTRFNVLAFSDHQDVSDRTRLRSILARRVPEDEVQRLGAAGIAARFRAGDAPVVLPPSGDDSLGRVAHPIRGDKQVFGAIWVAVSRDLGPDALRRLAGFSRVAARHFLQEHLDADRTAREQTRRLRDVLDGSAPESVVDGLELSRGVSVLAVRPRRRAEQDPGVDGDLDLQRLGTALRMQLVAAHPGSLVAPIDGVVYAVVPTRGPEPVAKARAAALASQFAESAAGLGHDVTIGIGGPVRDPAAVARARDDADRVLRSSAGDDARRVHHVDDVQVRIWMMELGALVQDRDLRLTGPVAAIAAFDRDGRSSLLATLEAWLNSFGDVRSTADAMHVHPNTARYRLRRAVEVGGIDLESCEARFEAMMQIRLMRACGWVGATVEPGVAP